MDYSSYDHDEQQKHNHSFSLLMVSLIWKDRERDV